VRLALTIAGSDSGGGAGIQADLKTFHQFGVFGTSVLVAVTAQNTQGVSAVHAIPVDIVRAQMAALAADLAPHATKTGMLATPELVDAVAGGIRQFGFPNLVVDPVMVATSGDRLLTVDAERLVAEQLVPIATVVTPNIHEAQILVGHPIEGPDDMEEAGRALVESGAGAALVKGGHLDLGQGSETMVVDVLVTAHEVTRFTHAKVATTSTHGTGCTLSSAIAAGLARGAGLMSAVEDALDFVHRAIRSAPGLGAGHGPLNHFEPAAYDT
jgi:hydroxymethylpyrimidine/phosphomethylpyrimidine kinase